MTKRELERAVALQIARNVRRVLSTQGVSEAEIRAAIDRAIARDRDVELERQRAASPDQPSPPVDSTPDE